MNHVRVGDISVQIRGVSYKKSDVRTEPADGYTALLRGGNIGAHGLILEDLQYVPTKAVSEKQILRVGDVVLVASSGSLDVVGKAAAINNSFAGTFGAFCKVLRPLSNVDHRYFAHYFKTPRYRHIISSLAAGANINNLKNGHLDELKLPFPSLVQQHRIADILDKADALRTKRREVIERLDALKQSIFHNMFGDVRELLEAHPSGRLQDYAEQITDGEHLTPKRSSEGYPLLSARNVRSGYIAWSPIDYVPDSEYQRIAKRCAPRKGDVLISCSGTIGRVAPVVEDTKFALVRSVALVRPSPCQLLQGYLVAYLQTPYMQERMRRAANTSSQANLFQGPIRTLPVAVPPLQQQERFTGRITAVESLKEKHCAQLAELDNLFLSLQDRAFRGEL